MSLRPGSRAERFYVRLLHAFPARFRASYGQDVLEAFRDRHAEAAAGGHMAVAWLWARTIPNVVWNGLLERLAESRRWAASLDMGASVRSALRSLVRSPGLSAVIVLTLGVGMGANVALFSVLRGVLFKPLPYPEADRLVRLWETNPAVDDERHGPSPWNFTDWQRGSSEFESMAAWFSTSVTLRTDDFVEELRTAQVTVDFFRTLGVSPVLGRDFLAGDGAGAQRLALSDAAWRRLFGGDGGVIGRTVMAGGQARQIVAVMPPGFSFPEVGIDVWLAWDLPEAYADRPEARSWRFLDGVARLAPGVSVDETEDRLDATAAGLAVTHPETNTGWDAAVSPFRDEIVGEVRGVLWLAFGSVFFVLLIACANVANLLLARAPAKSRELAIRKALGATRRRVVADELLQSALLGLAAGLIGLGLGLVVLDLLVALDAGRIPRLDEVSIDPAVVAFTAVVALGTSVAFGSVPALRSLRTPGSAVGDGVRATEGPRERRRRDVFVASQVAMAFVLLACAGLLSASLGRLVADDPGFDPGGVATVRVSLDGTGASAAETVSYFDGLLRELAALPGVSAVGAAQTLPLDPVGNDFRRPYRRAGSGIDVAEASTANMRIITPGYVRTMGMTMLAGADFPAGLRPDQPLVALVNTTLANRLSPAGSAVGRQFELEFREGWQVYEIVGVVRDVKHYGPRVVPEPEVFLAHGQVPYAGMSVAVKTVEEPTSMREALLTTVSSHPPMQPAYGFATLEALVAASTAEDRFLAVLLWLLSGIGLTLACTGVYAVVAYTVSHRRREIGVRMALGADGDRVVSALLARAGLVSAAGLAAGLAVLLALAPAMDRVLFEVSATDPLAVVTIGALLVGVSALAAWVPARRAARVQPSDALRSA